MTTKLVLVHGGALSGRMYRTTVPYLQKLGYTDVLTPDLPGHGSSKDLGPFSFARSTRHLHDIIQGLRSNSEDGRCKIIVVGISLGGQAVLDLISKYPGDADAVIVSGASIRPPDEAAGWQMPHMPPPDTDEGKEWHRIMQEDIDIMGMDNAMGLQNESFAFSFEPSRNAKLPRTMVLVGEHDVPMAMRDASEIFDKVNGHSEGSKMVIKEGWWHNHSIDVPEELAMLIKTWDEEQAAH